MFKPMQRLGLVVAVGMTPLLFAADEPITVKNDVTVVEDDGGGDIVIGKKQKARSANDKMTYEDCVELCRKLVQSAPTDALKKEQEEALVELGRYGKQGGEMILACVDPRVTADKDVRLGAIKAMEKLKMTGERVSGFRALAATIDPVEEVRLTHAHQIKDRKDDKATSTLINALMASYNDDGKVINKAAADNIIQALRVNKSDKRIYQALLYHVTMELRIGNSELVAAPTTQINTYTMLSGANGAVLIPLALPITMPQIKHTVVKTTVSAPAINALQDLTGEEFGDDVNAWMRWMKKQK